jgi:hypothetical protein
LVLGGIIIHFGDGITLFGVGILGIGIHTEQSQDIMCIRTEFNHHNLQDMKEDNLLEQGRVEFNKMNHKDGFLPHKTKEIVNQVDLTTHIHRDLNQVEYKVTNRVEFKHLQGFNNEQIHLLRHNQREVESKIEKIKVFFVFLTIFPSILTKNLSLQ